MGPTRQESQVWPVASSASQSTGNTPLNPSRNPPAVGGNPGASGTAGPGNVTSGASGAGGGTAGAAVSGAAGAGAVGGGDGDLWWDDGDGWHLHGGGAVNGAAGYHYERGDTYGAMYGGGGGKQDQSYMRWGAEGGVWFGDRYPLGGGGDNGGGGAGGAGGGGEQEGGQWARDGGAPARWSGFSEVGDIGVRTTDAVGTGLEEHLPFMVTHTLVKVLRDPLLSAHYQVGAK